MIQSLPLSSYNPKMNVWQIVLLSVVSAVPLAACHTTMS